MATVTDTNEDSVKVTWPGYPKQYDCWILKDSVRLPVEKRPMITRNAISKSSFPRKGDPKYLEKDDKIYDTVRHLTLTVAINDPFKCEVLRVFFFL